MRFLGSSARLFAPLPSRVSRTLLAPHARLALHSSSHSPKKRKQGNEKRKIMPIFRLKSNSLFQAPSRNDNFHPFRTRLRSVSNVVLLPCRTKLIEFNSTFSRNLEPSHATAVVLQALPCSTELNLDNLPSEIKLCYSRASLARQ